MSVRSSGRPARPWSRSASGYGGLVARVETALLPLAFATCGGRLEAETRHRAGSSRSSARYNSADSARVRCTDRGTEVVPLGAALGLESRSPPTLGVRERDPWLVTEMCCQLSIDTVKSQVVSSYLVKPPLGPPPGPRAWCDRLEACFRAAASRTVARYATPPRWRTRQRRWWPNQG